MPILCDDKVPFESIDRSIALKSTVIKVEPPSHNFLPLFTLIQWITQYFDWTGI